MAHLGFFFVLCALSVPLFLIVLMLHPEVDGAQPAIWAIFFGWPILAGWLPWVTGVLDSVVLTRDGVEMHRLATSRWAGTLDGKDAPIYRLHGTSVRPADAGVVPWEDVERVSVFKCRGTMVGVRLRSTDAFVASMDVPEPAVSPRTKRVMVGIGALLFLGSLFSPDDDGDDGGSDDDAVSIRDSRAARAAMLASNRRIWGYELMFGRTDRDRSAERFAELLRSYIPRPDEGPAAPPAEPPQGATRARYRRPGRRIVGR